jgi:hypothetical protein
VPEGIELGERISPTLLALLIAALSGARRMNWANGFLPQTLSRTASHYNTRRRISVKTPPDKDS